MQTNVWLWVCIIWAGLTVGCGGAVGPEETNDAAPRSSVPAPLATNWLESWSHYTGYAFEPALYDPELERWFKGAYDPWSMQPRPGFGLQLAANGDFVWTVVVDSGVGGCRSYTAEFLKGTVVVEGTGITFHPSVRRKKYHSTCNPELAFDRDEPTVSFHMEYQLPESSVLTLSEPGKNALTFYAGP